MRKQVYRLMILLPAPLLSIALLSIALIGSAGLSPSIVLAGEPAFQALDPYDRCGAIAYADYWWDGRNPHYQDYVDVDCANFVSQCLIAGGISLWRGMDGAGAGVYSDSFGTMPFCDYLHEHLVNWQDVTHTVIVGGGAPPDDLEPGDVIIYGDAEDPWRHAVIVTEGYGDEALINCHSSNRYHEDWDYIFPDYYPVANFYQFNTRDFEPEDISQYTVATPGLNVRAGPSVDYQILGVIGTDQKYAVIGSHTWPGGQTWYQIWLDDRIGWCASWYGADTQSDVQVRVAYDTAPVYAGPSTVYPFLGTIQCGMTFTAERRSRGWVRIHWGGGTAWCPGASLAVLRTSPYSYGW